MSQVGSQNSLFTWPGARSGYIAKRFLNRSAYIGSLLLDDRGDLKAIVANLLEVSHLKVASVGGAAGSDFVGIASWKAFLNSPVPHSISCTVYEYEVGWREPVLLLNSIMKKRGLYGKEEGDSALNSIDFSGGNVLAPISPETNSKLHSEAPSTNLFFFSYVLVENSKGLQASNFQFLSDLFSLAMKGAVFIFMDSSFKLWDPIEQLAQNLWGVENCRLVRPKNKAYGNTLVLQKQ